MRKLAVFLGVVALSFFLVYSMGCDRAKDESPLAPDQGPIEIPEEIIVEYVGNETLEDVVSSFDKVEELTGRKFSELEREEIIRDFLTYRSGEEGTLKSSSLAASTVTAYTYHYVWKGGTDLWDLYLEYKWWAGYRRSYHFATPVWSMYWLIQRCYRGRILSWSWMEGRYQRVTAVVGLCLYGPYGGGSGAGNFIRSYLWLISH